MTVFGERMRWVTRVAAPILPTDVCDKCLRVLGFDLKGGGERAFSIHDDLRVRRSFHARNLAFERERPLTPLASDEVDEATGKQDLNLPRRQRMHERDTPFAAAGTCLNLSAPP